MLRILLPCLAAAVFLLTAIGCAGSRDRGMVITSVDAVTGEEAARPYYLQTLRYGAQPLHYEVVDDIGSPIWSKPGQQLSVAPSSLRYQATPPALLVTDAGENVLAFIVLPER